MANKSLIESNDQYSRLLLCEWFFIEKQTNEEKINALTDEINSLQKEIRSVPKKPKLQEVSGIGKKTAFLLFSIALFIGNLILTILIMSKYGSWFLEYSYLLLYIVGLIGLVILLSPLASFSLFVYELYGLHGLKRQKKEKRLEYERQEAAYRKKAKTHEGLTAKNQGVIDRLTEERSALQKTQPILEQAYANSLLFLYQKYRNIVCVCQFTQYLESGRCDAFEGAHGCYNLFEEEAKMNLIVSKLETIIDRLTSIENNQIEMFNVLKSIDSNVRKIRGDTKEIRRNSAVIALATMQIRNQIADLKQTVAEMGESIDSIDSRYRQWS